MRVSILIFVLFAMLATEAEDMSTWQKQMPITFSGYTPPGGGTLTNFPALVILSNTAAGVGFNYADFLSPPYGDLRFTASDKTTPLNFEVEKWDVSGNSYVWVQVPVLAGTNTRILAFWGKSGVSAPACTTNGDVWINGFNGVWHLGLASATQLDSTANGNNATPSGGVVTGVVGKIAGAIKLNGINGYFSVPHNASIAMTDNFTAEVWFKRDAFGVFDGFLSKESAAYTKGWSMVYNNNSPQNFAAYIPAAYRPCNATGVQNDFTWHHMVMRLQNGLVNLFLDGVQQAATSAATITDSGKAMLFGKFDFDVDDHYHNGLLDEIRVSNVPRSSNWVWAAYMNMASNAVFNDYGAPKYGGAPDIVNSNAVVTIPYTTLNGYLVSTGMDANVSACVYWGTNDAGSALSGWTYTNRFPVPAVIGPLSTSVVPTVAGAKHYYRFYATNSFSDSWASPSGTFVWLGAPTVNNAGGATNVFSSFATLQGEVTGGNPTPNAWIYWGTVNQGVNKTLWEHETPVGVASNWTFSANVSLTPGLTYYYRCYASNTYGEAWAPVTNFVAVLHNKTWTGAGADALASNPANWVGNIAPIAGDDIKLDATSSKNMTWDLNISLSTWTQAGYLGTVTVATVYGSVGFTNFTIRGNCIISNGVWTHFANTTIEANRLRVSIGGNLIIDANGTINVTGRGYWPGYGPGAGGGGSHGGRGSPSGPCYGSIIAPTNLGSGGSVYTGGGAILLTVSGMLRNDGIICADGDPVTPNQWAGSGGSIYLVSGTLTGNGEIRAKGGNVGANGRAGGGRIALVVTNSTANFSSYTGSVLTPAGAGGVGGSGGGFASAGTIYLEKSDDDPGRGELIVNNIGGTPGYDTASTDINGIEAMTYEFRRITLTNNASLRIGPDDTLIVTNTVLSGANVNNGIWIAGGTLRVPSAFTYSNMFIAISHTAATLTAASSLTIGTNAVFRMNVPYELTTDVIIEPGGKLTHIPNPGSEAYKLDLTLNGSLTVKEGGSVDVTGCGYAAGVGPGTHPLNNSGASYGGLGVGGLSCYGSLIAPTNLGSGGRLAGVGGGAIILNVSGVVSNGGAILANAAELTYRTGAGGSIYITAGMLKGSGPIQANSATNVTGDSPGGGGRIALAVTNAGTDFSGYPVNLITAYGGRKKPSGTSGGAGTIYLRDSSQGLYEGTLIVDNDNLNGIATEISPAVTDTIVGNVIIRNKGFLRINTNQTLALSSTWNNSASFTGLTDSAVIFVGAAGSTSRVYGSTTFMGLLCTNGIGKTIMFQAGTVNSIAAYGRLWLAGSPVVTNLFLRSMSDGLAWKLNVDPWADQAISSVDVKDSDALIGIGAEVIAINSKDSTGNSNWRFMSAFPGQTLTWTGNSNTIWSMRENWDLDRAPLETDVIVIPGGLARYPVLDANRTLHDLSIRSGASLELAGRNLTVTNNLTVAGALIASGKEIVTLLKDADFTGGSFDSAQSLLLLAGGNDQSINLAGLTFYKIRVDNSSGTLAFMQGFIGTEFRCEAPYGTPSLVFQAGAKVSVCDIVLLGSTLSANIAMRSSTPGSPWDIAVSRYRLVQGVDVKDSNAGRGLPIPAAASKNSGNNVNWQFSGPSIWLGTSGSSFNTADNWSSGVVPDSTTRIVVETANPMIISSPVRILDLTVGGGAGRASVTANAALTVGENISILNNGKLTLNRHTIIRNNVCVFSGGTLTHSINSMNEANRLDLAIFGDLTIEENAIVDVATLGYISGQGPGTGSGGSYGGLGVNAGPCYGSILAPTNCGSGGGGGVFMHGGGVVYFAVSGAILHDGLICADGQCTAAQLAGSGGSVYLRSGTLTGRGMIRANGGDYSGGAIGNGPAGGGRIALIVTNVGANFASYTGTIQARCSNNNGIYLAGAGTIYQQTWADHPGRGTVWVNNSGFRGYTYIPATFAPTGEADRAIFRISNAARLRLTNDFMLGDIRLDSANAWLDLGSNTLTVRSREHSLEPGFVTNYGAIIWWPEIPKGTIYFAK